MSARRIGAATLLVVGTLLWSAAILGVWAQRQALNTDNWVSTSDRLLENDQVRNALAVAIVDRVYDADAVQQRLRDSLPPRLDALAAPAASGLREVALRNAPRVLGTAAALNAWETANRGAHKAFLALVDGRLAPGGTVTLDVQDLVRRVATSTGLPAGVADKLPPNVAQLQILKSDQLATVQDAVGLFRDAVVFLIIAAIAAFLGAIALSDSRRHSVVTVGVCLMIAALLVLAVRRVAGAAVTDSLASAPNVHAVAGDIWSIATSLLVDAALGSFLFGALMASAAWVAGPGRVATSVRRVNAPPLRELAVLRDEGVLTPEEFEAAKRKLLAA